MTEPERPMRAGGRGILVAHTAVWGTAAAAFYVLASVASTQWGLPPGRVLYDGLAPLPPYRWMRPPPELARDNQPPEPGEATLPLTAGSPPGSVTTGDGQASVIFETTTVAPARGESAVRVSLVPLDPAGVAAPPSGTRFDGNAYRIDARYAASGMPVNLQAPATIVLRYATGASRMARVSESGWSALQTITYPGGLQLLVAKPDALGVFVPLAPQGLPYTHPSRGWIYVVAGISVLIALLIGYMPRVLARLRGRGNSQCREARRDRDNGS